jgi:hypothetical protein
MEGLATFAYVLERDTAQLICEGACNPMITRTDKDIKGLLHTTLDNEGGVIAPLDDRDLVRRLRLLVHTPHEGRGSWWRCTVCARARRWGGELV